jgi:hypothetical protein
VSDDSKATLRSCTLIRLPPLETAGKKWQLPAAKLDIPKWELDCCGPAGTRSLFYTGLLPPGAKVEHPDGPASQAARSDGDAAPSSADATSSSPAGPAGAGAGSQWLSEAEKECATCGAKRDDPGVELQLCSGCCAVRYCSPACQKADWKAHRAACRALRAGTG